MYNLILQIINTIFPLPKIYEIKDSISYNRNEAFRTKEELNKLRKSLKSFKF